MKYKELYAYGSDRLKKAGIAEAALDARLMLEHVCHTDRNDLLVHGDKEIAEEQQENYVNCIRRRTAHEPLQYITGEQEFMGLTFEVNPQVLIPRQDTETLVEETMRILHDGMNILDMCTGSGCILLSLMKYSNNCSGIGADISEEALKVARRNAERLQIEDVCFMQSNLFDKIEERFDVIISNPPYIKSGVIPELMEEVRDYEPIGALDGTENGLFFYDAIIKEAPQYLNRGGYLLFEIGCDQAEEVSARMENAGFKAVSVVKDLAGLDRVVYGYYY